ncbi:hypothetical protein Tco_1286695 [Tanacetum coccineum]
MDKIRVDVCKINTNGEEKSLHEEIKSIRTSEISYEKSYPKSNIHPTNLKDTFEHYLKQSCKRKDVLNEWMKKFMINTEINLKDHDSSLKRLEENVNHLAQLISTHNLTNQECAIKLELAREKPTLKVEIFTEKVKRRILKEDSKGEPIHTTLINTEHTQHLQKLVSREIRIKELSMAKLNARCSAILQNELPPTEKDLGSFILPCTIGTTTIRHALANLGSSIRSARLNNDSNGMFYNPNSNSSLSLDDFVEIDDVWDNLDLWDLTNEATNSPVKPEFLSTRNRIHLHSPYNLQITCKMRFVNFDPYIEPQSPFNIMSQKAYNTIMIHELVCTGNNMVVFARNLHVFFGGHQFLTDFIILENINKFVEKGLTEVLFGQPFKEHVGIVEDRVKVFI